MSRVVCIQSERGAILAGQPPYDRLEVAERVTVSRSFLKKDCAPGEVLARQGRPVEYVGFVQSGVFDIYDDKACEGCRHLGSLHPGDFFGDLSALLSGAAIGSLACRLGGRCYLQEKADFEKTLSQHQSLHTFFLQNALSKLWAIYQQGQPEIDDSQAGETETLEMPRIIEKSLAYIEKHFQRPLTLEELSSDVGLSRFHLSRTFKQYLGKSFKEYLTERRIAEAKNLMAHQDKNVTEACFAVGFNDTSYFARVFRKHENLSPSAYRKRMDNRRRLFAPALGPVRALRL